MRRKDREMSEEYGLSVIDRAEYGTLSIIDYTEPELPYAIPLSIARIEHKLYFHSAKSGHKTELLKDGARARVVFVDKVRVPDFFDQQELVQIAEAGEIGKQLSKIFTTEFSSAIVTGIVRQISATKEFPEYESAMRAICEKYVPDKMILFEAALEMSLERMAVYAIEIDSIKAKRKKFDAQNEEMKWQRME